MLPGGIIVKALNQSLQLYPYNIIILLSAYCEITI